MATATAANDQKNLQNIQRIDKLAKKILLHCNQAALYEFSLDENKWQDTETMGPLFVYERNGQPCYALMIANRQSLIDYTEPIMANMNLKYEPPYILIHRDGGGILGVWVYGEDECKRFYDTIVKLRDSPENKNNRNPSPTSMAPPKENKSSQGPASSVTPPKSKSAEETNKWYIPDDKNSAIRKDLAKSGGQPKTEKPKFQTLPFNAQQMQPLGVIKKMVGNKAATAQTTTNKQALTTGQPAKSLESKEPPKDVGKGKETTPPHQVPLVDKLFMSANIVADPSIVKKFMQSVPNAKPTNAEAEQLTTKKSEPTAIAHVPVVAEQKKSPVLPTPVKSTRSSSSPTDENKMVENAGKSGTQTTPTTTRASPKQQALVSPKLLSAIKQDIHTLQQIVLTFIKRKDPFASKVVSYVSNVVLYEFDADESKWVNTQMSGPLVVYARLDAPQYSLMVLDNPEEGQGRVREEDFIEPIVPTLKADYRAPYIFLSGCSNGKYYGLWMQHEEERKRLFCDLTKLIG